MHDTHQHALTQEWVTLQNNHEQYERSALLIKIVAFLVPTICLIVRYDASTYSLALIVLVGGLWLQETIIRTSQTRLGERLLRIEALCRTLETNKPALQLHSEWLASRAGFMGLLGEYARNAMRPTVAYPYAPLIATLGILMFAIEQ